MSELIFYLLKVNVALVLFYLVYYLVLRRLTFYALNRIFLIFGIVFSTICPIIDITDLLSRNDELNKKLIVISPTWHTTASLTLPTDALSVEDILLYIFWMGVGIMALRLIVQLISLARIHQLSSPDQHQHIFFRRVTENINPFSFWKSVYLNPTQHQEHELLPILQHELVHIRDWHTLDVLLAEISTVFYWFNPGAWLMKMAIKQNLEFITDQKVLQSGLDSKTYQYSLIRISTLSGATPLANNFNFLTIKTRIAMMNKMPSTNIQRFKFLIVIPVIAGLILAFNGIAQTTEAIKKEVLPPPPPPVPAIPEMPPPPPTPISSLDDFLNYHTQIKDVKYNSGKLIIQLKSGLKETYDLNNKKSKEAAEKKYGALPFSPPPPPPAVKEAEAYIELTEEAVIGRSEIKPSNESVRTGQPDTYTIIQGMRILNPTTNPDPLYLLNGKKIDKSQVSSMDPNTISSIDVIKGKTAVLKYGKEAQYGAVIITTKDKTQTLKEVNQVEISEPEEVVVIGFSSKSTAETVKVQPKATSAPTDNNEVVVVGKKLPDVKTENTLENISRKNKEAMVLQELKSDGLYSSDKYYTFRITNTAMYLNNQKQPDNLFQKYRKYLPHPNKNVPWQTFEVKGRFRER